MRVVGPTQWKKRCESIMREASTIICTCPWTMSSFVMWRITKPYIASFPPFTEEEGKRKKNRNREQTVALLNSKQVFKKSYQDLKPLLSLSLSYRFQTKRFPCVVFSYFSTPFLLSSPCPSPWKPFLTYLEIALKRMCPWRMISMHWDHGCLVNACQTKPRHFESFHVTVTCIWVLTVLSHRVP